MVYEEIVVIVKSLLVQVTIVDKVLVSVFIKTTQKSLNDFTQENIIPCVDLSTYVRVEVYEILNPKEVVIKKAFIKKGIKLRNNKI